MNIDLRHGDCLEILKDIPDNSVDSVVTDPPYGLSFMGKRWDYEVPSIEVWAECLRVLKPGGHLLSFAGSRTYHRMAVNIEDAGFEIRDQIMWVYGSGFPKSHNISKAIDKAAGAERIVVGHREWNDPMNKPYTNAHFGGDRCRDDKPMPITAPATPEAKQWEGWGSALKPAHEPIVVARKPLIGTIVENVLEYGTGGLNIDGCRVATDENPSGKRRKGKPPIREGGVWNNDRRSAESFAEERKGEAKGRFPANFIHDGSDEVVVSFPNRTHRFFYCAKASKGERASGNNHPTVKPIALMQYLCRLVTPKNGVVLDPFMGSGTTGIAAKDCGYGFIGIEREENYMEIAKHRIWNVRFDQDKPVVHEWL